MRRTWHRDSRTEPAHGREGTARRAPHQWWLVLRFVCLAACLPAHAAAQSLELNQYAHRTWRASEIGMAAGAQRIKFAQTPDGYLWLGTIAGLYRFDGVRAARWPSAAHPPLPFDWIWSLYTSRDGTLWIGGDKGLAKLRDDKLTIDSSLTGQEVNAIFEDSRGAIWLGLRQNSSTGYGASPRLCVIRAGVNSCFRDERFGDIVRDVFEDRSGRIWVVSSSGVWRWTPDAPEYYQVGTHSRQITYAAEGDDGAIYAASENGVVRLVAGKFRPYTIPGIRGRVAGGRLFRSRDGSLWISSPDYGIYHVHRGKTDRFNSGDGLSSDRIHELFEDREGNVWIDTGNGIDQFRPVAAPRLPATMGLSNGTVWSVLATPDSSVWLSTPTGLNRWHAGRVTIYADDAPDGRAGSGILRPVLNGDVHSPVYSLGMDIHGSVWASTMRGISHLSAGEFVPVRGGIKGTAHAIAGDRRGDIWINYMFIGLYRWTPGDTVQQVVKFPESGRNTMTALAADLRGNGLWAAQQGAGYVYMDSGRARSTYGPSRNPGSASNDLRMTSDGALWSASADGLTRMKGASSATLSARNGLPCNFVHWSIEDDLGWRWMRMSCGLVRVARTEIDAWVRDPSKHVAVQRFSRYAAITDDQFGAKFYTRPAVTKASDGRIWFADAEGAGVIDPRIVPFNDTPPPVYIEGLFADSATYYPAKPALSPVRLKPRVRNVRIEFTAPGFTLPERVRFRFMLKGQDPRWREVINQRRVEYSNLSPGTYHFRVTAANSDGIWNTSGASLEFIVPPAWNQAWWFFAFVVTGIAASAAGAAVAWQRRRGRLAAERAQTHFDATLAERTRVARELHDTLLGDMAGMAMQLNAGAKRVAASAEPNANVVELLSSLSKQVQRSLVDARRAVTAMRTERRNETLSLHTRITTAAERAFANSGIVTNIEQIGLPSHYPLSVEEEVVGIATESMMNARQHADCRAVTITCRYAPDELRVSVHDDGRGFDASEASPAGHWGLIGMRERAASISATLSITSSPTSGTEIVIAVPVEPR